jgi:prevent-host-death family protein
MNNYSVGVREAKMNLSKLLKKVKKGQEIVITDRGKPVGKIVALPPKELSLIERIEQLEDQVLAPINPPSFLTMSAPSFLMARYTSPSNACRFTQRGCILLCAIR